MIREAGPEDAVRMEAFLSQHAGTSMFLRGNLAAHGTQDRQHRHGTTFTIEDRGGVLTAVGGVTNAGFVMCQSIETPSDFHTVFARSLKGRTLHGMTGAPVQVGAVFAALGCQLAEFSLRVTEPLFVLETSTLVSAEHMAGRLRKPFPTDAEWLTEWFRGFHAETGLMPSGVAEGRTAAEHFTDAADARILMMGDQPVAMANFNARAQETVQIGGVFVPPAFRGKGYGGGIVARQLLEARKEGISLAILFAASDIAARAYKAIGFQRIGSYELALFNEPWQVPQ